MQEKIYLRHLNLSDINQRYLSWVNDPAVTEYLEIGKQRMKHKDLVAYIEDSLKNGRHNYAIITNDSEHHIGNCSIYGIESEKKRFKIGWFIGEKKFWGGHYSSMIIFYLLKIGFIEMKLERCTGGVNEKHTKARMTNKFSGFREIRKCNIRIGNKSITTIKLEITKKDWLKRAKLLHSQFPEFYNFL
jgi:ribosomal-protein-alanine N-acetyltransferase